MNRPLGLGAALVLALGIAAAGLFTGYGFMAGRGADRYVTVKGISERDVMADVALWPLRFVATNDDLAQAQSDIQRNHEQVAAFLGRHGVDPGSVEVQRLQVTDRLANPYGNQQPLGSRYIVAQTLIVRSTAPEVIAEAAQAVGELVASGVVLSAEGYESGPTYLFTRLSDLKPEMIAEATAKARRAAGQFASDSGSRLGGIRRANQGVFQILARDRAPGIAEPGQLQKTVRVVATVEYFLRD